MGYIETQFQLAEIFTEARDADTFIKFRDMMVVSASTLNLVVKKIMELEMNKSAELAEPAERKQRK